MNWDQLVLKIQSGLDRVVRWVRLVPDHAGDYRRFLIIQIDGLSHGRLLKAIQARQLPFLARLLQSGGVELRRFSCGLPTSTPAFQAGIMYGETQDIPSFHWYDKRRHMDMHMLLASVASRVEQLHAAGRKGILKDGTSYGCIFGGEADVAMVNLSRMGKPHLGLDYSTLRFFIPSVISLWVMGKIVLLSAMELLKGIYAIGVDCMQGRAERMTGKVLLLKVVFSVILRQLFTLWVSHDVYRGLPAIYVNFLAYDTYGHHYGPDHRMSLRVLREIDSSIRQIYRIVRRVPELHYDIFILSDHGQIASVPFEDVSGGASFKDFMLATLTHTRLARSTHPLDAVEKQQTELMREVSYISRISDLRTTLSWPLSALCRKYLQFLRRDFCQRLRVDIDLTFVDHTVIVPAGPNVLVYFTHTQDRVTLDEVEELFPGLIDRLSGHPGIGLILGMDREGPVYVYRQQKFRIGPRPQLSPDHPFYGRPDLALVMDGLAKWIQMPGSGDLTVLGHYARAGTVSYVREFGSHAGPSEEEMSAFIIHPRHIGYPFEEARQASDLYPFFIKYRMDRERQVGVEGGEIACSETTASACSYHSSDLQHP